MTIQPLLQASEWIVAVVAGAIIAIGLFAFLYDIRAVWQKRRLRSTGTIDLGQNLHVTILVYTKNNETTVEACLDAIMQSNYRFYDIVVIDNQSTDGTRRVLKRYQQNHVLDPIYVYNSRRLASQQRLLQHGYNRSHKGQIVLVIDGTSLLLPTLLADTVTVFVCNPKLQVVRLNQGILDVSSPVELYYCFVRLSQNVFMKAISIFSSGRTVAPQSNTLYRNAVFKKSTSVHKISYTYNSSLSLTHVSLRSPRQLPIILSIFVVFFMTFFMYVAATMQTNMLLLMSWLIVSLWLILAVWADESSSLKQKAILTFCVPVAYFLCYAHLLLQIIYNSTKYVVAKTSPFVVTRHEPISTTEHKL